MILPVQEIECYDKFIDHNSPNDAVQCCGSVCVHSLIHICHQSPDSI